MIPVKEATRIALEMARPPGVVEATLREAVGMVLAEDIFSDIDMPPFDKSSMDGYALLSSDAGQTPVELAVAGTIPAGTMPDFKLRSGQAAKIMTGAPMPAGADSVQMVEKTGPSADAGVRILEPVSPGQHVAKRGEVVKANSKVLSAGTYISPAVIGLLAAVGRAVVRTYRRVNVGILVTGDELVDVAEKPAPGQIRNSNGFAIAAQVENAGAEAESLGVASDDPIGLHEKIKEGLLFDLLLITGGVSMGEFDFVERVLAERHAEIFYEKVSIKPGKPTVFARVGNTLVFGLPGNPVSASTVFDVIVRPLLLKMMGFQRLENVRVHARLLTDVRSKTKRESYQPACTIYRGSEFLVTPVASKGSADVLAHANSNSYLIAPGNRDEYSAGSEIEVLLRDDFWKGHIPDGIRATLDVPRVDP